MQQKSPEDYSSKIVTLICAIDILRDNMLITFDGPNGAGKTTLIHAVFDRISKEYPTRITCEPTKDLFGEYVRKNEGGLRGLSYLFLIASNRSWHVEKEITPYSNEIILCDRYIASSLALQHAEGVSLADIWSVNQFFPRPDIAFIITAPAQDLKERLALRDNKTYFEESLSRQQEVDLFNEAYHFLKKHRIDVTIVQNPNGKERESENIIFNRITEKLKGTRHE